MPCHFLTQALSARSVTRRRAFLDPPSTSGPSRCPFRAIFEPFSSPFRARRARLRRSHKHDFVQRVARAPRSRAVSPARGVLASGRSSSLTACSALFTHSLTAHRYTLLFASGAQGAAISPRSCSYSTHTHTQAQVGWNDTHT